VKIFILTICLIGILISSGACQENKWSKTNTIMELTWVSLHLIDWNQTIQIAHNPDKYYERNFILGRHPSERSVNRFMVSGLIIHTGVSLVLPKKQRLLWQAASIIVAGVVITNNFRIGLTF
jgi:hypothetical protein